MNTMTGLKDRLMLWHYGYWMKNWLKGRSQMVVVNGDTFGW